MRGCMGSAGHAASRNVHSNCLCAGLFHGTNPRSETTMRAPERRIEHITRGLLSATPRNRNARSFPVSTHTSNTSCNFPDSAKCPFVGQTPNKIPFARRFSCRFLRCYNRLHRRLSRRRQALGAQLLEYRLALKDSVLSNVALQRPPTFATPPQKKVGILFCCDNQLGAS